jgi:hypothetical protein
MRRTSLIARRERQVAASAPGTDLPTDHPLPRASDAVTYTARQCLYAAAVLTGSVIAVIESDRWAMPLAYSAASVLIVLTGLLFGHVQRERDCAMALILEGREGLDLAPVQRQRKRLLAPRTTERLIEELEDAVRLARRPTHSVSLTPPRFEASVVVPLADDIHDVMSLLGDRRCSARAVASAEQLVEQAVSPLYGQDVDALRDELRRLRFLLKERLP